MAGILEDLFNTRTHGNGRLRSEWDDVLLKRDLERLIAEARVKVLKEVPRVGRDVPSVPAECARKWFLDCATGDTYAYTEQWERGEPRFDKASSDDLYQ